MGEVRVQPLKETNKSNRVEEGVIVLNDDAKTLFQGREHQASRASLDGILERFDQQQYMLYGLKRCTA